VFLTYLYLTSVVSTVTNRLSKHTRPQRGQGMVEYALVIAVVAVIAIVGLRFLGTNLSSTFSNIVNNLNLPNAGGTPLPTATP